MRPRTCVQPLQDISCESRPPGVSVDAHALCVQVLQGVVCHAWQDGVSEESTCHPGRIWERGCWRLGWFPSLGVRALQLTAAWLWVPMGNAKW